MTRFRLSAATLTFLFGLLALLAPGETACGAVMKTFYVSPKGDDANRAPRRSPSPRSAGPGTRSARSTGT